MYELFYKYFILNHRTGLPGIGNFYLESIPSKIDIVTRTLSAPSHKILFSQGKAELDQSFFDFLAAELKMNSIDISKYFNEFARTIRETATEEGGAHLPGLGTLIQNEQEEFIFHPEYKSSTLLPLIHLNDSVAANSKIVDVYDSGETKIIRQKKAAAAEEKIVMSESDDYWWVYAVILALMGFGALLYYYI